MDIFKFINSKDIAAHLKEIGYSFTPTECAFLIDQSNAVLSEKMAAWEEIIDTMPDCRIEKRVWLKEQNLHTLLRNYIALLSRLKESFYMKGDNSVYACRYYCKEEEYGNDYEWDEGFDHIFPDFNSCMEFAESRADFEMIEVKKQWLYDPERTVVLQMNSDKVILGVRATGLTEEEEEIFDAFQCMWFAFPTPFKKGDVLCCPRRPNTVRYPFDNKPFVLTDLCCWGEKELSENGERDKKRLEKADEAVQHYKKNGDAADMTAYGYFLADDGSIYYECMHAYLNLEYFRGEPVGMQNALIALSNYLKDKIDVGLLMESYRILSLEENAAAARKYLFCTDELLKLAGLKRREV